MSNRTPDSFLLNISYFLLKVTLGTLIRLIWVKRVDGLEHLPREGAAIAAFNHQSYFDFLCFVAICPRNIHYLAAEKFFTHPVWGILMKATGQIRVERKSHEKQELHDLVFKHFAAGKLIGIFPEGTRSSHRHEMGPAFTGVARYAVRAKVPVIPVGVTGTFDVMSRHDKKPRFKKIVIFHIGPPIHFHKYHDTNPSEATHRSLTDEIMFRIAELSGKKYLHAVKTL